MNKKIILSVFLGLFVLSVLFISCYRQSELPLVDIENTSPREDVTIEYKFERNGLSTVDLSEGIKVIDMFERLDRGFRVPSRFVTEYYTDNTTLGVSLSDLVAKSPYYLDKNEEAELIRSEMKQFIDSFPPVVERQTLRARKGFAGFVGYEEERRYVDGFGISLGQVVQKGLMGAILLDQILNYHLGQEVLNNKQLQEDNTNNVLVEGKRYTQLERHWDMAYSYIGKENTLFRPLFIAFYLEIGVRSMPFLDGIDRRVYNAFYNGRKAVVNKNYEEMKRQANIIREELNRLFAARAIFYINTGIRDLREDVRNSFHGLSEAYGFIYALNFSRKQDGNRYMSREEIDALLKEFKGKEGFWDVDRLGADENTEGSLAKISKIIADKFSFKPSDI